MININNNLDQDILNIIINYISFNCKWCKKKIYINTNYYYIDNNYYCNCYCYNYKISNL